VAKTEPDEYAPILPGPGESDYERYIRTDELLALQKTPDEWVHRDELLFQTVHQSSELWLKHAWVEVEEATRLIEARSLAPALRLLRRANLALRYVEGFLEHLELMSPWEYQEVRRVLGHGSGFDSPGFREIRRVSTPLYGAFDALRRERGLSLLEVYTQGREHAGHLPARGTSDRVGRARRRVALPAFQGRRADHRRGRRRDAGNAGRAPRGPDQEQDVPRALERPHRSHRAREVARLIPLDEIRRARERVADAVTRTPLVRLEVDAPCEIWLKLESLQPIGSFKLRGALSAVRAAAPAELAGGVVTASAGNMAQGVAWAAREAGVRARIVAPESAPRAKLDAVERLGGEVISVSHEIWWQTMVERRYEGVDGLFVHPVDDDAVMAGNGTIGLELVEDLPELDAVVVPWGGGGLTTGIASAVKALRPNTRVVTAEPATAAPLAASLAAGAPTEIDYRPSFVDGAGGRALLPTMWDRARELVDDAVAVSLDEVAHAMRILAARARIVAEGAGALALAAALRGDAGEGRVVCIVSGGNIDAAVLARILAGETP